jgi:hypothetical protein
MAGTLSKPSDKADRPKRPVPKRIVQNAGCPKRGACFVALLGFKVRATTFVARLASIRIL